MTTPEETFVKIILGGWNTQHQRTDKLLATLTDEQLMTEVAPGRNTGQYILGHLIAVHDHLFPVLGLGERLYPELDAVFITTPDKSGQTMPGVAELRIYWQTIGQELDRHFATMTRADWLGPHNTISADDFAREPHRNKLNVILFRTTHLAYHLGQLVLLGGQA